ncbi:MAG: hypothetical protein ACR2OJ_12115, partial [Hyphomicrobiales bacterium]
MSIFKHTLSGKKQNMQSMDNELKKSVLVEIAKKIRDNERLDVSYAEPFLHHKFQELSSFSSLM